MKNKKFFKSYYLIKGNYCNNERMFLSLENEKDYFGDITINIPNVELQENEIILSNDLDFFRSKIEKTGLYEIIRKINYNFGVYYIAKLNNDIIGKYALNIKEAM
ncbi:MAG: hypothetical protein WC343_02840 [Bacilli bacterium]|jgi:hypothetical protein